jgi:hypothetical protein
MNELKAKYDATVMMVAASRLIGTALLGGDSADTLLCMVKSVATIATSQRSPGVTAEMMAKLLCEQLTQNIKDMFTAVDSESDPAKGKAMMRASIELARGGPISDEHRTAFIGLGLMDDAGNVTDHGRQAAKNAETMIAAGIL